MSNLTDTLKAFDGNRASNNEELEAMFKDIAKIVFYQGRFVINDEIEIYPTDIEFYFHSEREDAPEWMKDYGMYHINDSREYPYFHLCSIFPHNSGVDVRFENEHKKFRASFYIRKYEYEFPGEKRASSECPTQSWEDIFGQNSFDRPNGYNIKWTEYNCAPEDIKEPKIDVRENLCIYDAPYKPRNVEKGNMKGRAHRLQDERKRRFIKE